MSDLAPLLFPLEASAGRDQLAMVVRRTYRVYGARLVPVVTHDTYPEEEATDAARDRTALLVMDLLAATKPSTDVLVSGTAHPRGRSVRMLDTGVAVGALRKYVRAWGQRKIVLDAAARLRFTEPDTLAPTPITWENAYGGRDTFAESTTRSAGLASDRLGETISYPRNPEGRGFALDLERGRLDDTLAPSLEDPEDPVTAGRMLARSPLDWVERPIAACYEPIGPLQFPRVAFFLAPLFEPAEPKVVEVSRRILTAAELTARRCLAVPDPRFQACAPVGLRGERLQGNERISLWNLHPQHERLDVQLPGQRPRLLLEPPGCRTYELTPVLQTVHVEPDLDRVTLTWSGTLDVAARYPEELCAQMRRAVQWET